MLGSRTSSSIRSSTYLELYIGGVALERQLEAAGQLGERLVHVGFGGALGLADRGDDQIFEQRGVAVLHRVRPDLQRLQHLLAVDDRGHRAAARAGLEALFGELLLHLGHLLLHLLGLLHHVAKALHRSVLSAARSRRSMMSPWNHRIAFSINGFTSASRGGSFASSGAQRSVSERPKTMVS